MTEKSASVLCSGAGKQGVGKISTESGALMDHPYGFASRCGDDRRGTYPEEILGATHAVVPGLDEARFQELAASARRDCPLSRALASVPVISLGAIRHGPARTR